MQQLRSSTLDRRRFLRDASLLGLSLVVENSMAATPAKLESIAEIPDYQVSIWDWTPVDVTDKFWMIREFRPGNFDSPSENHAWWRSRQIDYSSGNSDLMSRFIGKGHTEHCLFDGNNRRVYILADGDEKLVGFPNASFSVNSLSTNRTADNGTTIYYVNWPLRLYKPGEASRGDEGTEALIIADIKNKKKIVIKEKNRFSRTEMHMSDISFKGNVGVIQGRNRFYVFDIPSGRIVYASNDEHPRRRDEIDPKFENMNHDGSVIVFNDGGIYSRLDLRNKELTELYRQDWTHNNFVVSPNGNYVACAVELSGPSRVRFYIHSTKERYTIVVPSKDRDGPMSVADDGTLKAYSGRYKYQGGDLFWDGIDRPPNGLRFVKNK